MKEVYVEEFMSPGCVGCPQVKEMLNELSSELKGNMIVEEVDITEDTIRSAQYGIMSVPAVAINGILEFVGVPSREELRKALVEALEG